MLLSTVSPAQSPPEGLFFFLDKKEPKNQDSGNASFAAQAFAPHSVKTTGRKDLPPVSRKANASGKSALPLQPHGPPSFCLIHPEAGPLSGEEKYLLLIQLPR